VLVFGLRCWKNPTTQADFSFLTSPKVKLHSERTSLCKNFTLQELHSEGTSLDFVKFAAQVKLLMQ
jgi:hypothetical protein